MTSVWGLVLAVTAASVAGSVIERKPLERTLFNLANEMVGCLLAYLTVAVVLQGSAPTHLRGALAIAVAALVLQLSTVANVLLAITLSTQRPSRAHLRSMAASLALMWPINAILAIVTITVAQAELWGVVLLAIPAILLAVWYRTSNALRDRYENLQVLYDFTVKLAALTDTDEIIAAALVQARSVMRSKTAELTLPLGEGCLRCTITETDGVLRQFTSLNSFESRIIESTVPVVLKKGKGDYPGDEPSQDLIAVPIPLGGAMCGVARVSDHITEDESFDREDLRLFEALAAHLSTALTSSQRLERLSEEVEAREYQALHDSLTGLANRTAFAQWVSHALERRADQEMSAVMLMDLDGFKDINDTLGHHTGDVILAEVASRIQQVAGSGGQAARLGGDEFGLVLPHAMGIEEILQMANDILAAVSKPINVEALVLEPRASLGVAIAPQHGLDPTTLLQRADVAMYSAKSAKRGVVAYNKEIDQNTRRRLTLATDLRHALDSNDLEVWYQPVASIGNGRIVGFEALTRWRHSQYGSVSPGEFIPVAEQTGLIEPLTWWVLATALKELQQWGADGYEMTMAVNISARNLMAPDVVERLGYLLAQIGVPPSELTLEITESLMMVDPDAAEKILNQLAELGVCIAIDDFGTGYSSLSRLKRLPVTTVKIDRSFVFAMHRDEGDDAIVRTTIDLAHNMGLSVIAEGVEFQETWDRLAHLGCEMAQGYLMAPAMPSEECHNWVRARQAPLMAPIRRLSTAFGA